MSRDAFLLSWTSGLHVCTGKNWRVASEVEHDEIIDFLLKQADGSDTGSIGCKKRRWMANMAIILYNGFKKLVRRESHLEVVKRSKIFDRIHDIVIFLGHAGRDKVYVQISSKYFNIPVHLNAIYLSTCKTCDEKRSRPPKSVVVKPIHV